MYVGVLPYTYDINNNLLFLLGRERYVEGWKDSHLWSGFGGKLEKKDISIIEGAAREAYEESMGILGTVEQIVNNIYRDYNLLIIENHNKNNIIENINSSEIQNYLKNINLNKDKVRYAAIFLYNIDYDSNLPIKY